MKNIDLSEFKRKKTAFVCSGGVVKAAAWHTGVSLALEDLGFHFRSNNDQTTPDQIDQAPSLEVSTYVGSSAGALICLYLASGYTPHDIVHSTLGSSKAKFRSITYKNMLSLKKPMRKPRRNSAYRPFESFPLIIRQLLSPFAHFTGFFTTSGIAKHLEDQILLSQKFEDYYPDLFIVATQLDHSRKVIFSKYNYPSPMHDPTSVYYTGTNISDAAAASMSVPPFYSPYPIKNPVTNQVDYYIDGEIRETLSTHVAVDNHCDLVISSWTHTPYHYHDEIGSLINYGLPAISVQAIYLMIQKKIVSSQAKRLANEDLMNTVSAYMKSEGFTNAQRNNILSILERKLHYKPNVKFIDICPRHDDYHLFFSSSFSLNPETCTKTARMGYKRTLEVLKQHDF